MGQAFRTNIHSQFYLSKAAVPHMKPGSAIVNTASINSKSPSPTLLPYATTKGAIANFTVGLAQLLADKGIRVNCVALGPVWTPLIPSTMPPEKVEHFGDNTPPWPRGAAVGVGAGLRPAGVAAGQLHHRRHAAGDRQPAHAVMSSPRSSLAIPP